MPNQNNHTEFNLLESTSRQKTCFSLWRKICLRHWVVLNHPNMSLWYASCFFFASAAPILFLDEPTSNLDAFQALNVMNCLRRVASGASVLLSFELCIASIAWGLYPHSFDALCFWCIWCTGLCRWWKFRIFQKFSLIGLEMAKQPTTHAHLRPVFFGVFELQNYGFDSIE